MTASTTRILVAVSLGFFLLTADVAFAQRSGRARSRSGGDGQAGAPANPGPRAVPRPRETSPQPASRERPRARAPEGDRGAGRRDPGNNEGTSTSGRTGSTADQAGSGNGDNDSQRRRVPDYSRPRDGQRATGRAVPRGSVPSPRPPSRSVFIRPYYPYGAFGLGYFYYDPYWWGYPGYGYGYGYPGYGYPGYGYPGYLSGGYGRYQTSYIDTGSLRLKVKPRDAQVFVDGYFAGVVNDFDGVFQRLRLDPGPHRIELRADGYEPMTFEVRILADETLTYRGEMRRLP